jgi:hypothetical protein
MSTRAETLVEAIRMVIEREAKVVVAPSPDGVDVVVRRAKLGIQLTPAVNPLYNLVGRGARGQETQG